MQEHTWKENARSMPSRASSGGGPSSPITNMNREEARRVSINHCLQDDEIEGAESLCKQADPGAWRVAHGRVVGYREQILGPGSLQLMAASVCLVPRLIRGIRALEEALRSAWASAETWKNQYSRERDAHTATAHRAAAGERMESGICAVAELVALTSGREQNLPRIADLLRRWQGGEDVAAFLKHELESLRKHAAELEAARKEIEEERAALIREARRIVADKGKKK